MPKDSVTLPDAACRGVPVELFFPPKPKRGDLGAGVVQRLQVAAAKAICAQCPSDTRRDCLEGAIARHERFGIWGGATFEERRQLRRRQRGVA